MIKKLGSPLNSPNSPVSPWVFFLRWFRRRSLSRALRQKVFVHAPVANFPCSTARRCVFFFVPCFFFSHLSSFYSPPLLVIVGEKVKGFLWYKYVFGKQIEVGRLDHPVLVSTNQRRKKTPERHAPTLHPFTWQKKTKPDPKPCTFGDVRGKGKEKSMK